MVGDGEKKFRGARSEAESSGGYFNRKFWKAAAVSGETLEPLAPNGTLQNLRSFRTPCCLAASNENNGPASMLEGLGVGYSYVRGSEGTRHGKEGAFEAALLLPSLQLTN
jgi:hypothetical protein